MKLTYPLKRVQYITQRFGANAPYYSQFTIGGVALKGHEGLDLRAADGTEVVACDEGEVSEASDQGSKGYGRYIKLLHSWGESVYAHLKEFRVSKGDKVAQGQTIALSDNTGNSSASHLHFGIRINVYNKSDGWGGYSDPEPHFGEEGENMVINDQTKIDLGELGIMEVQAIRSTLTDQKRDIKVQMDKIDTLELRVSALEAQLAQSKPEFSNPIAKLLFSLAEAFEKK